MKTISAATFIGFATYLFMGGIPTIPGFLKFKFNRPKFVNKKLQDQNFLEYLWLLKSELTSGRQLANVELKAPPHYLEQRLILIFQICAESGASITPTLNRFIRQTKNQIEMQQEIDSELASTRATVTVLACLPIFGLFLGSLLNSNTLSWLFNSGAGRICFSLGIILNLVGIYWIKQIIKRSLVT